MKQTLYSLMLLFALGWSVAAHADEKAQWCLVVESAAGETIAIGADLKPVISTTAEGYELKYGDVVSTFAWNELKTVRVQETVADASATAVRSIETPADFQLQRGQIAINGAKPGTQASIYSVDGRLVRTATVAPDGSVNLSTNGLSRNVYIIKTNNTTFKIKK